MQAPEVLQAQKPLTHEPEQHSLNVVQEPEFLHAVAQAPFTQEPEQHSLYEVQDPEVLQVGC